MTNRMIEYTVKVYPDGSKHWYLNGKRHREDGPACEYVNGDKSWYLNGKYHREDGPAIEYGDGYKAYYLNDKLLTEQEHNRANGSVLMGGFVGAIVVGSRCYLDWLLGRGCNHYCYQKRCCEKCGLTQYKGETK